MGVGSAAPCPMPHAPCPVPHALCPMPCAPCPMPCAPCPVPHAPCPMPCAPCPMVPFVPAVARLQGPLGPKWLQELAGSENQGHVPKRWRHRCFRESGPFVPRRVGERE